MSGTIVGSILAPSRLRSGRPFTLARSELCTQRRTAAMPLCRHAGHDICSTDFQSISCGSLYTVASLCRDRAHERMSTVHVCVFLCVAELAAKVAMKLSSITSRTIYQVHSSMHQPNSPWNSSGCAVSWERFYNFLPKWQVVVTP